MATGLKLGIDLGAGKYDDRKQPDTAAMAEGNAGREAGHKAAKRCLGAEHQGSIGRG
jgi:hypothetical protein